MMTMKMAMRKNREWGGVDSGVFNVVDYNYDDDDDNDDDDDDDDDNNENDDNDNEKEERVRGRRQWSLWCHQHTIIPLPPRPLSTPLLSS